MVLLNPKEGEPNPVWEHHVPNVDQTCVKIFKPDDNKTPPSVFVTSQDKAIREIVNGQEACSYVQNINLNQLDMLHNGRAFFTGVNETSKPGSVQVIMHPFTRGKIFETQAHAQTCNRLRISYDNQTLYSAGADGTLAVFQIIDKNPRDKGDKRELPNMMSAEILIKKKQRDELQ